MATNLKHRGTRPGISTRSGRPGHRRWFWVILVTLGFAVVAAGCGEDEPELTMAQRLAEVEGQELSEAELNDRLAVGNTLCAMDDAVLDAIWRQLNERQLNYQDVVFGHICPDRSVFYASLSGRYVTAEATESGVAPSTTRPPLTTIAPPSTTTTTVPPVSSESSVVDNEEDPGADGDNPDEPSQTTTPPQTTSSTTASVTTSTTPAATTQPTISSVTTVVGEGG